MKDNFVRKGYRERESDKQTQSERKRDREGMRAERQRE